MPSEAQDGVQLPKHVLQQLSSAVDALDNLMLHTPGGDACNTVTASTEEEHGSLCDAQQLLATQCRLQEREAELAALRVSMAGLQDELDSNKSEAEQALQVLLPRHMDNMFSHCLDNRSSSHGCTAQSTSTWQCSNRRKTFAKAPKNEPTWQSGKLTLPV